jgi:c(7)-type cytochrome triheme protein
MLRLSLWHAAGPFGARLEQRGRRIPLAAQADRLRARDASPGTVTFRHETHLGGTRTCTSCHPKPFAMTAARRPAGGMHQADACGSCHDGKRSFAVESADACGRCHVDGGSP